MMFGDELRQIVINSVITPLTIFTHIKENFITHFQKQCIEEAKKGKYSYTFNYKDGETLNLPDDLDSLEENLSRLLKETYGLTCCLRYEPNDRFVTGSGLKITLIWHD